MSTKVFQSSFAVVRMSIIILAIWTSTLAANRAVASCGDYLMPLHSAEAGSKASPVSVGWMHDLQLQTKADLLHVGSDDSRRAPCHGPNCGRAPSQSMQNAVIVVPEQTQNYFASNNNAGFRFPFPLSWDLRPVADTASPSPALDGLLRPPRKARPLYSAISHIA